MTKKINYDVWGQRFHPCTVELFKACKQKVGKSWNLSMYEVVKEFLEEEEFNKIINQYKKHNKDICQD